MAFCQSPTVVGCCCQCRDTISLKSGNSKTMATVRQSSCDMALREGRVVGSMALAPWLPRRRVLEAYD